MSLWDVYNQHFKNATFTDLTHEFFPGQPKFPALPDQTISTFLSLERGDLFEITQYGFVGQWGTHVDPPGHMHRGGRKLAELEVSQMLLPLCVLDVSKKVSSDPDYCPTLEDVHEWERRHGTIPTGSFVALRTDWSKRWPDPLAMSNPDSSGTAHFPGWRLEVLRVLLEERGVAAVGHETTDTDGGIATTLRGSWALESYILGQDRWQLELLKDLDKVPETGALLLASWPKPKNGSGFPARAVAIY